MPDAQRSIAADETGIHFLHGGQDIVVFWDEIAGISGLRGQAADRASFIEVFVELFSGVDFGFSSVDVGYEQVIGEMGNHLVGFRRAALEAVGTFDDEGQTIPVVWERDVAVQPFQLRPPVIGPRDPTPAERVQIETAHRATIATCERVLGRPLQPHELECVRTGFANGRIVGSIVPPLRDLLVQRGGAE